MTKKPVAYVPGTWDLFHIGHINLLRRASRIASSIIICVDTDESVKRDKGQCPTIPYRDRAEILKACRYVDKVVRNNHTIPLVSRLRQLGINVIILGDCWQGKYLPGLLEAEAVLKILYLPYTKGISTTSIKMKIREDRTALEEIRT